MKIECFLDYHRILAGQATPVHLAIRLTAPETPAATRAQASAFCVVLDKSGSMGGAPLESAKAAAALAVRHLRPNDWFSLVAFDSEARTIIPMQASRHKRAWAAHIQGLQAGGSTNLTGGWMLGRDQLRAAPPEAGRRLLLLSDGHLNEGIIEPDAVQSIVLAGLQADRIRTACLGFGDSYNEDLLAQLSRTTHGEFYDANSAEKFPAIFASELEGLQKVASQNVRLRIKPLEFCEAFAPLGEYPATPLPDGRMEFALGDLVSGEERIVCFAVQVLALPQVLGVPAFKLEGERLLELEFAYDAVTAGAAASKNLTQIIRIQATQDPAEVHPNDEPVSWISTQKVGRVMNEAAPLSGPGRFRCRDAGRSGRGSLARGPSRAAVP